MMNALEVSEHLAVNHWGTGVDPDEDGAVSVSAYAELELCIPEGITPPAAFADWGQVWCGGDGPGEPGRPGWMGWRRHYFVQQTAVPAWMGLGYREDLAAILQRYIQRAMMDDGIEPEWLPVILGEYIVPYDAD